ncbi:MAG: hypothetical protein KDK36_05180, partial [Leptospiraceae bacterium]|nr:hypothetical protein [Leptospiraceae bacterium]
KFKFKNKDFILISKKIIETHMNSLKSLDMKVNLISGRVLRKEVDRMGERKVKAYKEPPRPLIKIQEFTPYE